MQNDRFGGFGHGTSATATGNGGAGNSNPSSSSSSSISDTLNQVFTRLDALTKTQTDLITYLHAELERRRDWEEKMSKDLLQRHNTLLSLWSPMVYGTPSGPGGSSSGNSGLANGGPGQGGELMGSLGSANGLNGSMYGATGSGQGGGARAPGSSVGAGGSNFAHQPAMNAYAPSRDSFAPQSQAEVMASMPGPHRAGGYGVNALGNEGDQYGGGSRLNPVDPTFHGILQSTLNQHGGFRHDGQSTATNSKANASGAGASKRKRRGSDASSDDGGPKAVEVDERGVVYMASGKKAGEKPKKIQALVRKTIWASMGPDANTSSNPPNYIEGQLPPDGSGKWQFGNLRFEWDKTPKRSPHNALMKQIILDHILGLRSEYPEVPDADFTPNRLEAAFEQAFSTWRGKVSGRIKGRHHDDDD